MLVVRSSPLIDDVEGAWQVQGFGDGPSNGSFPRLISSDSRALAFTLSLVLA
jgi:hypothetical protein